MSVKPMIGTSEAKGIGLSSGDKKAWFHLGKVKAGTSEQEVSTFIKHSFNLECIVEKLDAKGINSSFKLGVDFEHRDVLLDSSVWPKHITLKRFLFKRQMTNHKPQEF